MKSILLHGLGQRSSSWRSVINEMDNRSDILCPELSEWLHNAEPCYSNLYRALEDYCARFDEPLNICGLSLGGILALNYAIDHSEKIHSLVLIATQVSMPRKLLKFQNMIFRLMPASIFQRMGFDKKSVIMLCNSMTKLDFRQDLKNINCRTLIVCGEKDNANKKASLKLKEQIKDAKIVMISNAGHEVNVDAPIELRKCLSAFLYH